MPKNTVVSLFVFYIFRADSDLNPSSKVKGK